MAIKVLLVDDEVNFQRVINQVLKREIKNEKYEFSFALNGLEALDKISAGLKVDVALVDIRMPQMDGLTLIEELNNRKIVSISSIIVSAYADTVNFQKAIQEKVSAFLVKPIEIEELEEAIGRAYLANKQNRQLSKPSEPKQAKRIKSLLDDPTSQQVTESIAYKIVRQLPTDKQLRVMRRLMEGFDLEELSDLKYDVETQECIEIEKQESRKEIAIQVYQQLGFDEAKLPLIALEQGFIEERVVKKTLLSGDLKDYGIHLYLRWMEGINDRRFYLGAAKSLDERTKALLVLLNYSPNKADIALDY
jgi:YesN/AraC family two-component response regulator